MGKRDAQDILNYWFSPENAPKRFEKNEAFDKEIRDNFLHLYEDAAQGDLDHWQSSAEGTLALVILLDQFSRNMFRGSPRAFATDAKAMQVVRRAIARGFDDELSDEYCVFLYVPFMHAEDLKTQEEGIELFKARNLGENERYAILHRDIIARFGRFPHRNDDLGRESTPEERAFLKTPGSSF